MLASTVVDHFTQINHAWYMFFRTIFSFLFFRSGESLYSMLIQFQPIRRRRQTAAVSSRLAEARIDRTHLL